jgi:hypothetical protein
MSWAHPNVAEGATFRMGHPGVSLFQSRSDFGAVFAEHLLRWVDEGVCPNVRAVVTCALSYLRA